MFSIADIRDIAIQIERNGERTYRKAGENASDQELTRVLLWLADEEQRHAKWFEKMRTSEKDMSDEHREMEAMGRALLRDMVKDQPFCLDADELEKAENLTQIAVQSLKFEKDTILFYDLLKSFITDNTDTVELDRIIEEERAHVRVMEKLVKKFAQGVDVDLSCEIP